MVDWFNAQKVQYLNLQRPISHSLQSSFAALPRTPSQVFRRGGLIRVTGSSTSTCRPLHLLGTIPWLPCFLSPVVESPHCHGSSRRLPHITRKRLSDGWLRPYPETRVLGNDEITFPPVLLAERHRGRMKAYLSRGLVPKQGGRRGLPRLKRKDARHCFRSFHRFAAAPLQASIRQPWLYIISSSSSPSRPALSDEGIIRRAGLWSNVQREETHHPPFPTLAPQHAWKDKRIENNNCKKAT